MVLMVRWVAALLSQIWTLFKKQGIEFFCRLFFCKTCILYTIFSIRKTLQSFLVICLFTMKRRLFLPLRLWGYLHNCFLDKLQVGGPFLYHLPKLYNNSITVEYLWIIETNLFYFWCIKCTTLSIDIIVCTCKIILNNSINIQEGYIYQKSHFLKHLYVLKMIQTVRPAGKM